jgi:4-alpha-glucanotransferase
MNVRGSGILMHISSLPSPYGIGDFGPDAYRFIDFLHSTHQRYLQVLPLTPVDPVCGNSPYSSASAFAGNILFLSPDLLCEAGYITRQSLAQTPQFDNSHCDFDKVITFKEALFTKAYQAFKKKKTNEYAYDEFCVREAWWLDDYVLFTVIKEKVCQRAWSEWPGELKFRDKKALYGVITEYADEVEKHKFLQFLFMKQWLDLKKYANDKGIHIIGDIPIYVRYDSADVWANSELFKLDGEKRQTVVAGVPPDYFSSTGQLWGNPVYDWSALKHQGYKWWIDRFKHTLKLFDMLRIDHFRGFVACWEVPVYEPTAINGKWVHAPVRDFFNTMYKRFTHFPVIAEDLGIITADVREELAYFNIPGMRVLLFAFYDDNPNHMYLPHMYPHDSVVYTGTHDNNTVRGWYHFETDYTVKDRLNRYVGMAIPDNEVHWEMIRLAMQSCARLVLIPLQDVLGTGAETRMNTPSVAKGNWSWRVTINQLTETVRARLAEMTYIYGRK